MDYIFKLYEMQINQLTKQNELMVQKQDTPVSMMTAIFKDMLTNQAKMNPLEFLKSMKEVGGDFFGGRARTREDIDADRDWQLSIMKEDLEIAKVKHDWSAQDKANEESKEHMQGFIAGLGNLVKDVAVPKLNKFIDGVTGGMQGGGGQRAPGPMQQPQPQPGQPQRVVLPPPPPGYQWARTPQGIALVRTGPMPGEQPGPEGMGMGMGMPMQGGGMTMGAPGSFEEAEEQRLQRAANNMNNMAHQINHKAAALQQWEQDLTRREQAQQAANQYAESKVKEANDVIRTAQFQKEQASNFEAFTKQELGVFYNDFRKRLEDIGRALQQKDKEELEQQANDINKDDTTPVTVSEQDVYQGEYEEDRQKLLDQRNNMQDEDSAVPSNAARDDQNPDTGAS
jgi:hypothetical protein